MTNYFVRLLQLVASVIVVFSTGCKNAEVSGFFEFGLSSGQAVLFGAPAVTNNLSTINISVGGSDVTNYRYAIGPSTLNCTTIDFYSLAQPIATAIRYSPTSDGKYILCVIGQVNNGTWQSESSPTIYAWTKDTARPTVTIDKSATQADPTNSNLITYDVVFSEQIESTSISTSDFTISSPFGSSASISSLTTSDNRNYSLVLQAFAPGDHTVALADFMVVDIAGNGNSGSTSTDSTVRYDAAFVNSSPEITSVDCKRIAYAGESYNCDVTATGTSDAGDSESWYIINNNCSFAVDITDVGSGVGSISYAPTSASSEVCSFEVEVRDGTSSSAPWKVQLEVIADAGLSMLAAGYKHACSIKDGKVHCWGDNGGTSGFLGANKNFDSHIPFRVEDSLGSSLLNIRQLSLGDQFSCARDSSGNVKCWGKNNYGQLGDGTTASKSHAVDTINSAVIQVSAGLDSACALMTDGSVKCWGAAAGGKLGNGLTANSTRPVSVVVDVAGTSTPISGAIDISVGETHACALMKDRKIMCWGNNNYGQLGQDNTIGSTTAINVKEFGLSSHKAISVVASKYSTCALLDDASVKCWGYGSNGQLGLGFNASSIGTSTNHMSHLQPVNFNGVWPVKKLIASHGEHFCAIGELREVRCWGKNLSGQLGLNSRTNVGDSDGGAVSSAIIISPWSNVTNVALGANFSCAQVSSPGTDAICWGSNSKYQLGAYYNPVQIGNDSNPMANMRSVYFNPHAIMRNTIVPDIEIAPNNLQLSVASDVSSTNRTIFAPKAFAKNAGQYYFEVTVDNTVSQNMRIGITNYNVSPSVIDLGADSHSCAFDLGAKTVIYQGIHMGSALAGASISNGTILGFHVNLNVSPIEITVTTTSGGSSNSETYRCLSSLSMTMPATDVVPAIMLVDASDRVTFNFGQSAFTHTMSGSFSDWTSY